VTTHTHTHTKANAPARQHTSTKQQHNCQQSHTTTARVTSHLCFLRTELLALSGPPRCKIQSRSSTHTLAFKRHFNRTSTMTMPCASSLLCTRYAQTCTLQSNAPDSTSTATEIAASSGLATHCLCTSTSSIVNLHDVERSRTTARSPQRSHRLCPLRKAHANLPNDVQRTPIIRYYIHFTVKPLPFPIAADAHCSRCQ
jgi:hypothetical protein